MSKCTVLKFWLVCVVPLMVHQNAEAAKTQDWDRMCITFNPADDLCRKLTDNQPPATREAADLSCKMAFDALERSGSNSCRGWRLPECRRLRGSQIFECSCVISTCDAYDIKTHKPFLFRECASKLKEEQKKNKDQPPAPSERFRRAQEEVDDDAEVYLELRRDSYDYSTGPPRPESFPSVKTLLEGPEHRKRARKSQGAGTSGVKRTSRDEGASSSPEGASSTQRSRTTVYECDICEKEFPTEGLLENHSDTHKGGTFCEYCFTDFPDKAALQAHYRPCMEIFWAKSRNRSNPWRWW